ncbi:MAG: cell division topological specificity factor MinE [Cyanobacteria bacterium J083]|nr:MAG: cell division topological specificity factor MinE [Cyanobacteria bacterium J083]
MLSELLRKILGWNKSTTSREDAKRRLKLVIAHDRASINPDMLQAMREEILNVVAKYVEIETENIEFALESDREMTALIANLPIRQIKSNISAKTNDNT